MATITIPKKEYQNIVQRQLLLEKEILLLKKGLLQSDEALIRPAILKRWERISRDLDKGKGRSFNSPKEMKGWLRTI